MVKVLTPRAAELSKYLANNKEAEEETETNVTSIMAGLITDIRVKKGETVKKGQVLMVIEAMKMENLVTSNQEGMVTDIFVRIGDTVSTGTELLLIE